MNPLVWIAKRLLVPVGLASLAFGCWRSFPVVGRRSAPKPELRVVLFDLSAGTTRLRPGHGLWARAQLLEQARLAAEAGAELGVGLYGEEVRRLGIAVPEQWIGRLEGRGGEVLRLSLDASGALGSNLDGALALFEDALTDLERPGAQLLLCAARDYSGADPRPRLARLAQAGVDVAWLDPGPALRPDLSLEALHLPQEPAPGEPLVAEFELALAGAGAARSGGWQFELALELEHSSGVTHLRLPLDVPSQPPDDDGVLRWRVRQELGATHLGRNALSARVLGVQSERGATADACPENDFFAAQCRSGEVKLITVVARAEQHGDVRAWLGRDPDRWPGLQWRIITPPELPSALDQTDLVLSFDLGPNELPADLLEAFVQGGGGLFFCGGHRALGGWIPGTAGSTGLARHLPLVPASPGNTPRDVIFLVDGSGSMADGPFDRVRQALVSLVASASPEDALSLRFFTSSLGEPLDLAAGEEGPLAALLRLMGSRVPGGSTSIFYSLEELLAERAGVQRDCLVFLLTDGKDHETYGGAKRGAALVLGFSTGESRLVPIAIGEDPDRKLLGHLLKEGDVLFEATDTLALAEFFQREVYGRRSREGQLGVVVAGQGKLSGTRDLLAAWKGLATDWPDLERFLRCEARPQADVLLRARESGEPLLAWQRVGSGRVAAWASAPIQGWGTGYLNADERLAPLFRFLATKPRGAGRLRLEMSGGLLSLQRVPDGWPAQVIATFYAQVPQLGLEHFLRSLELGETTLWVQGTGWAQDPMHERTGALPESLLKKASGAPAYVVLRDPATGQFLDQVGFFLPSPGEFRYSARASIGAHESAASPRPRAPRRARPDPRAWVWLALGLSLLSLGALGRSRVAGLRPKGLDA